MDSFRLNFTVLCFFILFFLFSINGVKSQLIPDPLTDITCSLINCGKGICKPANGTLLGVDCECSPGWKKIQIGALTLPPCVVPNCTVDIGCGNGAPPPPPPPAPLLPPLLNLSNPCAVTWCGEGTCVANGTTYTCKCNEGSANLMDLTGLPCFKECSFGADCNNLGFGNKPKAPPPTSDSTRNGAGEVPNCGGRHALAIFVLATTFLSWI